MPFKASTVESNVKRRTSRSNEHDVRDVTTASRARLHAMRMRKRALNKSPLDFIAVAALTNARVLSTCDDAWITELARYLLEARARDRRLDRTLRALLAPCP